MPAISPISTPHASKAFADPPERAAPNRTRRAGRNDKASENYVLGRVETAATWSTASTPTASAHYVYA